MQFTDNWLGFQFQHILVYFTVKCLGILLCFTTYMIFSAWQSSHLYSADYFMSVEASKHWLIWLKTSNLSSGAHVMKYNHSGTICEAIDKEVSAFLL